MIVLRLKIFQYLGIVIKYYFCETIAPFYHRNTFGAVVI